MTAADSPAFPEIHIHHFRNEDAEGQHDNVVPRWMGGLTKREYFAAMAMSALGAWHGGLHDAKLTCTTLADEAVAVADALIAELNKPEVA